MSLNEFKEFFGNGKKLGELSGKDGLFIRDHISPQLSQFLIQEGLCRYDNGFLFTVNPLDYTDIIKLILEGKTTGWVIARTCFGDLYILIGEGVYLYQPSFNKFIEITKGIGYLFNVFLVRTSFADKFLFRDIYPEAHALLGDAGYDECYGFVPAIPLGGPESVNNLRILKIKEYLSSIIQMQQ
jgi:hypothetical protein